MRQRSRANPTVFDGVDAFQERARRECGIPMPRQARETPPMVVGIVAVECPGCGGTNAWPANSKNNVCAFCGAKHRPLKVKAPQW
jgi:hypothetical protein